MQDINKLQEERKIIEAAINITGGGLVGSLTLWLKSIDSQIEKLNEKKPWKLNDGEVYYCPSGGYESRAFKREYYNGEWDKTCIANGWNCRTLEQAIYYTEKFTLIKAIDDWEALHNPEGWDWVTSHIVHGLEYSMKDERLITSNNRVLLSTYGRFATTELAEQFLTEFGERIIKYLVKGSNH